jgi:mannan endo-1,4-beta-mannosidase
MHHFRLFPHVSAALALLIGGCSSGAASPTNVGGAAGVTSVAGASGAAPAGGAGAGVGGALAGASGVGVAGAGAGGAGAGGGAGGGTGGMPTSVAPGETFKVDGRFLYDRCGTQVLLRGINEMIVWTDGRDGSPEFTEIAKTGANVVRIVWNNEGSAAELDVAIQNAVQAQLIPIVEHHGATGKIADVATVVDYWTQADVVQVLVKHQAHLLVNIANEAGDDKVTQESFEEAYKTAITRIRGAGVKVPLIIDAPSWGQDIDRLQASGPALVTHDPLHNLMFSVHMWWSDPAGARVKTELQQSVDQGLPLLVGEFAQHAVYLCDQSPFDYQVLLDEAKRLQIGWLVWSWGAVANSDCKGMGPFDMTTNGSFGSWSGTWASDVAVDHPGSIKNTSVRPSSMTTGACQ